MYSYWLTHFFQKLAAQALSEWKPLHEFNTANKGKKETLESLNLELTALNVLIKNQERYIITLDDQWLKWQTERAILADYIYRKDALEEKLKKIKAKQKKSLGYNIQLVYSNKKESQHEGKH